MEQVGEGKGKRGEERKKEVEKEEIGEGVENGREKRERVKMTEKEIQTVEGRGKRKT